MSTPDTTPAPLFPRSWGWIALGFALGFLTGVAFDTMWWIGAVLLLFAAVHIITYVVSSRR
ncbi:hypothetical protein KGD82_16085 [Nocardiopsis eucommiae]|uniref:Uncharacterized protein n=1 Tax=Nocardiopsis eucommiae TaxID=2831970 RepID=A0A975L731_9ACTN|nr:hypothetical protein KGD82_16085 [Nocardiopsis eucommiae]